ncbi:MAG: hypothetical protein U0835_07845 [Isosphaeraceae bacterium]
MHERAFDGLAEKADVLGFLIPGPREILLVLVVVMALYGRVGSRLLLATPYGRRIAPLLRLVQGPLQAARAESARAHASRPAARTRRRGPLFWALTLAGLAALAAWVATRFVIHQAASTPH